MISIILTTLVALEFLYIMYLETFATTSKQTARVFSLNENELENPLVVRLFQNQGVYNGLVAVLLLVALLLYFLIVKPLSCSLFIASVWHFMADIAQVRRYFSNKEPLFLPSLV